MIADIVKGETGAADLFFLVAVILFGIATLIQLVPLATERVGALLLVAAGLTSTALALLLL